MNRDQLIDSIVAEVKRVLADRGVAVAPAPDAARTVSAPAPAPAPASAPRPMAAQPVQPATPGTDFNVGSRDLTGKQILTQKDLEAYRGTTLRVSRRAVITPLAYDYAREKGITIVKVDTVQPRSESASASREEVTVALVVSSNFTGDKGVVTKLLSDMGFRVNDVSGQGYESAVKKLAAAVVSGGSHFGVCIENSGMEGPIFANRNDKARAVHCRSTIEARAARIDYGANVIVIDAASDPSAVIQGFCGM